MKNKKITLLATALAFVLSSGAANAAFTGDYAVSNWTFFSSDGGGAVDTSGAPSAITLWSSDTGHPSSSHGWNNHASHHDFFITAASESNISFNWDYQSFDTYYDPLDGIFASTDEDLFGYLHNGIFTQLNVSSDNDWGMMHQSGPYSVHLLAGEVFGFRFDNSDSTSGNASTAISNFNVTAVPEPETYAMFLAGLGLMGFMAWRRRSA